MPKTGLRRDGLLQGRFQGSIVQRKLATEQTVQGQASGGKEPIRTQKQNLVRVTVDEPLDGRVGLLVERVERQHGVVRDHARLEGDELAHDGVVPRVVPVDAAEYVRAFSGGLVTQPAVAFDALTRGCSWTTHVIRTDMVAASMPSTTS